MTGLYTRQDPLMVERQGYSLVKEGYKVTYIVCDNEKDEIKNGIEFISTGIKPQNRLQRLFLTKKILLKKAIEVNADIYQISDPELLSMVTILKRKGKKVIFNLREYYPDLVLHKKYIPSIARSLVSKYYSQLMNRYLPKYDAVFTVTPQVVDYLRAKHRVQQSYLLTNYPIPNPTFHLSEEEYMQRPNVLFYEGSIYAVSRQEKVFDALSEIDNIQYVLAGKIEPGYECIKNHPYWKSIIFIDGFKKEQLEFLFQNATIGNILRDFCGLDGSLGVIKLFESMEAALPVLLSDVPLYRNLVNKYHCGICVDPNDSNAIKAALNYFICNKQEAYQMGQNGRAAILKEYNWENQANIYLSVIKNIYS